MVPWGELTEPQYAALVSMLLQRVLPDAEVLDGSGGDGGRDVQVRRDGALTIYELKSFTGRLSSRSPNRRMQVERSLARAAEHHPSEWYLVVPIDHTPDELEWFDGLKEKFPFVRAWRGKTWLNAHLSGYPELVRGALRSVYEYLEDSVQVDHVRPVQEWSEQQLGVHPAIRGIAASDGGIDFTLPSYIQRDHDRQLRGLLAGAADGERARFVLVRGESCTGKTRTAVEAVRACLSGWQLVFPKTPGRLLTLLGAEAFAPRTVVWLNEAQNYLAPSQHGDDVAAALRSRLEAPGPLVIVGTLWPEHYRSLSASPERGHAGADARANTRALLELAVVVDVPESFSAELLEDPQVHSDSSLAEALATSAGGRITQTLAAGPQLVDHYEHAAGPDGVCGRAVVTAAMDARRLGHASPLPAGFLMASAPGYLTERQRADADANAWFTHALRFAHHRVRGVAAALEPVADPAGGMGAVPDLFHVSDYLEHHLRTVRRAVFPPETFWAAVRNYVTDIADLMALAKQAELRHRYRIAAGLYRRAADVGDLNALAELARLRTRADDPDGAERLWQEAADAGGIKALMTLAWLRDCAGEAATAERLARQAADLGFPEALRQLGERREHTGDPVGAARMYREAADAGDGAALEAEAARLKAAGDMVRAGQLRYRTMHAGATPLQRLMHLRQRAGDLAGAERVLQDAAADGDHSALRILRRRAEDAGDRAEAKRLARKAIDAGDSDAVATLVRLLEKDGDTSTAEHCAQSAAQVGNPFPLMVLVDLRKDTGAGTERLARQAAAAGNESAMRVVVKRCDGDGDSAKAEHIAVRAAAAGYTSALTALALRRELAGQPAEAERLARLSAGAGDAEILAELAHSRERASDWASATRFWQLAADAGNDSAVNHAQQVERGGRLADATDLYRRAADAGNPAALGALARLRATAGSRSDAERLWRQAADAGHREAFAELARLREAAGVPAEAERLALLSAVGGSTRGLISLIESRNRAGDTAGAERLAQQGADAGHVDALAKLAHLRLEAGDLASGERLALQAIDAGTLDGQVLATLAHSMPAAGAAPLWRFGLEADGSPARPW